MISTLETGAGPARHAARNILLEELIQGRSICLHSGSSSMQPQIIPGDILSIEPVSRNQLRCGDVVLMAAGDEWIVHRLLATRLIAGKAYALTRGDAVNRLDGLLPVECILGKVVKARRNDRETILKSTCQRRLMAWLSLKKLQALDHALAKRFAWRRVVNVYHALRVVLRRTKQPIRKKEDKKPDLDSLLLQCSLPAQDNLAELFQAIETTVGWEHFLKKADEEGLSGLIYCNWREQIANGLIPPEACRSLENAYLTTLARNTIFLAKLEKMAFALAGLDFIVLKGAYLASHVYASPGLRGFSDIDILVKPADLAGIDLRLKKIGYLPATTGVPPSQGVGTKAGQPAGGSAGPRENGMVCAYRPSSGPLSAPTVVIPSEARDLMLSQQFQTEIPRFARNDSSKTFLFSQKKRFPKGSGFLNSVMYYPSGNEIAVDLHWHLLNSMVSHYINATMDINEIWKAARPAQPRPLGESERSRPRPSTRGGLELCPEHLIIHLAEHALHHSYERLILLRDIAEVIIRLGDTLDWNRLVGECRKFNLARPAFYSLLFISRKTSVPVPAAALEALRPARMGRAEGLFISLALRGQRYPELCHLAYFDSLASGGQKIRFLLRLVFPCREVMALTYSKRPDEIGPGVYILRLAHGIEYLIRAILMHRNSKTVKATPCPQCYA